MKKTDQEQIASTRNLARIFVETPHISWILLFAVMLWGYFGYMGMPQRKDPYLAVRVAVALCPWPGMTAEKIEQLVTRKIEKKMAENEQVEKITSTTRTGLAIVFVELREKIDETGETFDDIDLKLRSIRDLPDGAGPVIFIKDFGDTAALMLTVASPGVSDVEVNLRSREVETVIENLRQKAKKKDVPGVPGERVSLVLVFSNSVDYRMIERHAELMARYLKDEGVFKDYLIYSGPSLVVIDAFPEKGDGAVAQALERYVSTRVRPSEVSPDMWEPVLIRNPKDAKKELAEATGSKYSYRELEEFTDLITRRLLAVPLVSKVTRWGVQEEAVYLEFSQERLGSYGITPWNIKDVLSTKNIAMPGGIVEFGGKNFIITPSGDFKGEDQIGSTIITSSRTGSNAYLRDLVDIERSYRTPPENLNYFISKDADGKWSRTRGITLAVNMRKGAKIGDFSEDVNAALAEVEALLPSDLIFARTSDQPRQVEESIDLFMEALSDAVWLVILVSLIGFWEWRSAMLMALSIPITLAMTFGIIHLFGIDLQQASIVSLIIALGLLVDDPVVANDAIKRDMADGHPLKIASWLGPTKLAKAIMYATITNCVAYLPFLLLKGDTGRYLFSLPVVVTTSLVASRIVSMTFIPFIGSFLLRPAKKPAPSIEERRAKGFTGAYFKFGGYLIKRRWWVFSLSIIPLVGSLWLVTELKPQFFPNDLSYLFYVDVWLPEDTPIRVTDETAAKAEKIIRDTLEKWGLEHPDKEGKPDKVLKHLTSFVGGGGPRFWFSVSPELSQPNYAQILIEISDKWLTPRIVDPLQVALLKAIPGARIDVRQLESGKPVGLPVQIRLSGQDMKRLRSEADKLKKIFSSLPQAYRVKDNWGSEIFQTRLTINTDKANMVGITNKDVAESSSAALNGFEVTKIRDGRLQIPVIARLRAEERAKIEDLQNLYVFSGNSGKRVPLRQISTIDYAMEREKIVRRNQYRTITVACFPVPGLLPSEVIEAVMPKLKTFEKGLPPGIRMEIGGEHQEQVNGFKDLVVVLLVSVACIYLALLFQFKNAVKPLLVFSAIPYGMVGAFVSLYVMGSPFGFMAFLGTISLIGVIVSHVIVLFDFIEEKMEEGEDLKLALLDAGIMRLRPVMITVGATVIALFPLAMTGGPLWEPLCYAQIGGLTLATFVTLLMVPVIYSIAAFDLKIVPGGRSKSIGSQE